MRYRNALAVVASCLAAFVACASFDAPPETTSAQDGGPDTSTPAPDAGAATALGESDPGVVACNDAGDPDDHECRTDSDAGCCYPNDVPRCNLECKNLWVSCDETADCAGGSKCCANPTMQISCAPTCLTQICKSASECGGAPCDPYECSGRIIGICSNSAVKPSTTHCRPK